MIWQILGQAASSNDILDREHAIQIAVVAVLLVILFAGLLYILIRMGVRDGVRDSGRGRKQP
jgi:hypothetical protein